MTLSWECVVWWSDLSYMWFYSQYNLEQVNNNPRILGITSTVFFYVNGAPFQPGLVPYKAYRASVSIYEIRGLDKMMEFKIIVKHLWH